jgi:hypothetical protein
MIFRLVPLQPPCGKLSRTIQQRILKKTHLLSSYRGLHEAIYKFITFYKFRSWTDSPHTAFDYTLLILYTLRMVAEGDRNM